jgi:hypothetical protein
MHYNKFSFSDIIGKRWPNVTKKDVTGKLAEALKPNLFKELRILRMTSEKNSEFRIKVGNYHPYSENIVRFGNYSKLALRKFPH